MNKVRRVPSLLKTALCAGIAALFIFPESSQAWAPAGHDAVAVIAQKRLNAKTLARIREILGSEIPLARIASCVDEVKKGDITCGGAFRMISRPSIKGWHFIDIPVNDSPAIPELEKYCSYNGEKNTCITAYIVKSAQTLSSPAAPRAQKQEALAYVVHLVGDLHQPLHCADEREIDGSYDRGGILKPVLPERSLGSIGLNLHVIWDYMIGLSPAVEVLEHNLGKKNTQSWTTGDFISSAAFESFKIARGTIYPSYHKENGRVVDDAYKNKMKPIIEERLQMAGIRLACLLERTLGK